MGARPICQVDFDVIVIGAGAAGLVAAIAAGERGQRVLLLEKNSKLGVKILMSGGTRCNITHNTDSSGIAEAYGRKGKFLHSALAAFPPDEILRWLEDEGVTTKVESTGKIFPVSDRAIDVRNALVRRMERSSNIKVCMNEPVKKIELLSEEYRNRYNVHSASRSAGSSSVIVTTGGKSYPGCGTVGDGYDWAEKLGHRIVPTVPALTPLVTPVQWIKDLKGLTIEDVFLGVFARSDLTRISDQNFCKLSLSSRRSSLLLTHFGLSGPAALDVSREVALRSRDEVALVIDFLPGLTSDELLGHLLSTEHARKSLQNAISEWLPNRLAVALSERLEIDSYTRLAEIGKKTKLKTVDILKRCIIDLEGTRGFQKAEVTAGGVDLKSVSSSTMESKHCPGLYFAGEILDLDGPIGGFNFQAAFSTGFLAGSNCNAS